MQNSATVFQYKERDNKSQMWSQYNNELFGVY